MEREARTTLPALVPFRIAEVMPVPDKGGSEHLRACHVHVATVALEAPFRHLVRQRHPSSMRRAKTLNTGFQEVRPLSEDICSVALCAMATERPATSMTIIRSHVMLVMQAVVGHNIHSFVECTQPLCFHNNNLVNANEILQNKSFDSHSTLYYTPLPHHSQPSSTLHAIDEATTEDLSQETLMRTSSEEDINTDPPPPRPLRP